MVHSTNFQVAARLRELADLLQQQGANSFRVSAYRRAADTITGMPEDLSALAAREGAQGLIALRGVGRSIAAAIQEILQTGRLAQLDRLRGTLDAEQVFQSIPGVGPELARRLHRELDVDSLQALEVAAHEGRLETVPGVGRRRASMISMALGDMLMTHRRSTDVTGVPPSVEVLLDVDDDYRRQAAENLLRKIAPRRFNPAGEAWLPILHSLRGKWEFTALYSNSARAHDFGRVRDWVVIHFQSDHEVDGQCTVVTETRGPLKDKRVVRGREAECEAFYAGENRVPLAEREQEVC